MMRLFTKSTEVNHPYVNNSDGWYPSHVTSGPSQSLDTATKFLTDLKRIADDMGRLLKPDGSKQYPARTCRDIADYYPKKNNG